MLSNREKWRSFCLAEPNIPLFMQGDWLDIISYDTDWDVALTRGNDDQITGALVYFTKRKWGMSIITIPAFCPFNGVWFSPVKTDKIYSYYATRRRIMKELIAQIPKASMTDIKLHYSNEDWLPFRWSGYRATPYYTHTIDLRKDMNEIWEGFKSSTRSKIQKAKQQSAIQTVGSLNDLAVFMKDLYDFKGVKNGTQLANILQKLALHPKLQERQKIWISLNEQGQTQAFLYLVWDANTAYYLTGGAHPDHRKQHAMYGLFWEAIQFSATQVETFDFEGSIIPEIERVFKSFGAVARSYFKLSKSGHRLIDIARIILGKNG